MIAAVSSSVVTRKAKVTSSSTTRDRCYLSKSHSGQKERMHESGPMHKLNPVQLIYAIYPFA